MTENVHGVSYVEALRIDRELTYTERLSVLFDVLATFDGDNIGTRSPGGPRLADIVIDPGGKATLVRAGDRTGAAVLAWEVLAGRPAEGERPRLHDIVDEVDPDVDELFERVLGGDEADMDARALLAELERAAGTSGADHAAVARAVFGPSPTESAPHGDAETAPPPPLASVASGPASDPFEEEWALPAAPISLPPSITELPAARSEPAPPLDVAPRVISDVREIANSAGLPSRSANSSEPAGGGAVDRASDERAAGACVGATRRDLGCDGKETCRGARSRGPCERSRALGAPRGETT